MKTNSAVAIAPAKISIKAGNSSQDAASLLNKDSTDANDICLKCAVTGKNCVCKKKKRKIAKYLLEDINEYKTSPDPLAQKRSRTESPNINENGGGGSGNAKSPTSEFNLESEIVNLECKILSNILDHHNNAAFAKDSSETLVPQLDKIPDLSGYIDSIGRPFGDYSALNSLFKDNVTKHPQSQQQPAAHPHSHSQPHVTSAESMDNVWIKGGLAAPNVVKPSLENIVSSDQIYSDNCQLPFSLNSTYLLQNKFASNIYAMDSKPHQDNRAIIRLCDLLRTRMEKKDIFRVAKAIEYVRPWILSFQSVLSFDDFAFIEKCHLRLRLEFERLFEFIGTPTIIWRVTGEITLVSREFTLMCWWKKEELEDGRKLIFELLDNACVVKYWEIFSVNAAENYDLGNSMRCSLSRPDHSTVPCAFSFNIKRDIFGIPIEIIGS
ncbi:Transcription activator of gluconeogenesis ERT1, partial [Smittium mucronatum]